MQPDVKFLSPEDPNYRYRVTLDHSWLAPYFTKNAAEIPMDAGFAVLGRDKNSHHGIGQRHGLRTLVASAVNQAFLDEICEIGELRHLDLGWPVTASDLGGLRRLKKLEALKINSPRNVTDFTPILDLPALRYLFIENARHLTSLDWLVPLKDRLVSLGIEGSIWTMQPISSLAPLAGFGFEALFLTSVRLKDKDLAPLADCPSLKLLTCARFAPKTSFEALKALRPDISCTWFDRYDV